MYQSKLIWFVCLVALVGLTGCGPGTVDLGTVPAAGKVTLDGQPVSGAKVAFSPQGSGGKAAVGITDDSGAFTLKTDGVGDGAKPGAYTVTVFKTAQAASTGPGLDYDKMTPEQIAEAGKQAQDLANAKDGPKAEDLLPEKYKSPSKSGLTVEIPDGGKEDIVLELTSK